MEETTHCYTAGELKNRLYRQIWYPSISNNEIDRICALYDIVFNDWVWTIVRKSDGYHIASKTNLRYALEYALTLL